MGTFALNNNVPELMIDTIDGGRLYGKSFAYAPGFPKQLVRLFIVYRLENPQAGR